jgi:hypothetical protein
MDGYATWVVYGEVSDEPHCHLTTLGHCEPGMTWPSC